MDEYLTTCWSAEPVQFGPPGLAGVGGATLVCPATCPGHGETRLQQFTTPRPTPSLAPTPSLGTDPSRAPTPSLGTNPSLAPAPDLSLVLSCSCSARRVIYVLV